MGNGNTFAAPKGTIEEVTHALEERVDEQRAEAAQASADRSGVLGAVAVPSAISGPATMRLALQVTAQTRF